MIRWLHASHLPKWAWSKGYYWHSKVCFLPWSLTWNWQRMKKKKKKKNTHTHTPKSQLPLTRSNIPAAPVCGVYISQVVHYSNPSAQYTDLLNRDSCWWSSIAKSLRSSSRSGFISGTRPAYPYGVTEFNQVFLLHYNVFTMY